MSAAEEVTAADFQMVYDDEHTFPFFETEGGLIMGIGHVDRAEFARLVTEYDALTDGYRHTTSEGEVSHVYATVERVTEGDEFSGFESGWAATWEGVTFTTPGAVAMTVVDR